jgi:hypothetical protein
LLELLTFVRIRYAVTPVKRLSLAVAGHAYRSLQNLLPRRKPLARNSELQGIHRGERCFILGSGRSIMNQDLKLLAGEIVMTQNNFHAHADIGIIAPRYHCVVQMYQPPKYAPDWVTWFTSMQNRLPTTTRLIAGDLSRELLDKHRLFENRVNYIHPGLSPLLLRHAAVDLTRNILDVPTALTQCLAVALYMGFSKIYLLGFDLSQMCEGRGSDYGRFYGLSPITSNQAERNFEDEDDISGNNWYTFWLMWVGFGLLRDEGLRLGSEIINATDGGMLSSFRREKYEDVIRSR